MQQRPYKYHKSTKPKSEKVCLRHFCTRNQEKVSNHFLPVVFFLLYAEDIGLLLTNCTRLAPSAATLWGGEEAAGLGRPAGGAQAAGREGLGLPDGRGVGQRAGGARAPPGGAGSGAACGRGGREAGRRRCSGAAAGGRALGRRGARRSSAAPCVHLWSETEGQVRESEAFFCNAGFRPLLETQCRGGFFCDCD
jgi:hypothetical protein